MRTIDDFRASGVNNILSAGDMAIPGNLAPALACVALFKRLEHGRILNVTSADFARAYKHAPRDGISKGVCDKSRDGGAFLGKPRNATNRMPPCSRLLGAGGGVREIRPTETFRRDRVRVFRRLLRNRTMRSAPISALIASDSVPGFRSRARIL